MEVLQYTPIYTYMKVADSFRKDNIFNWLMGQRVQTWVKTMINLTRECPFVWTTEAADPNFEYNFDYFKA